MNMALKDKEMQIDSIRKKGYVGQALLKEAETLFPQIGGCTYFDSYLFNTERKDAPEETAVVLFTINGKKLSRTDKEKISNWVQARLNKPDARVIFEFQ